MVCHARRQARVVGFSLPVTRKLLQAIQRQDPAGLIPHARDVENANRIEHRVAAHLWDRWGLRCVYTH